MAYLYWQLWQGWGWNPVLSLVIVLLVVAPVFALLVERVLMRPLYGAALSTMIVVTLGLFLVLYGLVATVWDQTVTRNLPKWFRGDQVDVLGVNLTYEQLITVGCAVAVALALWLLFKMTRMGVSMRAVVDDPSLASLTGARTNRIAGFAWIIGFMLAGLAGILLAPGTGMSIADPLRAGHLRLRRGHRRAPEQPAADLPGRHDPRRLRVAGRRVRPGQLSQRRRRPSCPWGCSSSPCSCCPRPS